MGAIMTKGELCEKYNIPPGTLRRIMERREISYCKLGGCVRFDEDDVLEYIRRSKVRPTMTTIQPMTAATSSRGSGRRNVNSQAATGYYPGMKVV